MPQPLRVSDISLYLRCPRIVYFEAMGHSPWQIRERAHSLLLREVALSLSDLSPDAEPSTLREDGLAAFLSSALERSASRLAIVYSGQIDPSHISSAAIEIRELIPLMAKSLSPLLSLILPSDVEVDLSSERLGLSGRLDRLVKRDPPLPSIIRSGMPPPDGVWRADRLRLTGYALLIEDLERRTERPQGRRIDCGLVEYPRAGVIREVAIRGIDRARVLRILDRVRQIKDGRLPDRPDGAPCDGCPLKEICDARWSLASKFF